MDFRNWLKANSDTWIKAWRSAPMNPAVMKDAEHFMLWHILLYSAVYAPQKDYFGGKPIVLQPGQLLTGRKALSEFTGISESKVQRILKTFEIEQQIEQRTSSSCRLITIKNWDKYQAGEQQTEQQVNSERTATEQRVNTTLINKEINNKRKKEYNSSSAADFRRDGFADFLKEGGEGK